ncbi:MAG: hypothetical protein AB6733_21620 [Clostridiaceae bacterium]
MIRKFEFVFVKPYESTGDIGFIVDLDRVGNRARVATLDMESAFSPKEVDINDLMPLPKIVVESVLVDITHSQKNYSYFIIMLNSFSELSQYHIKEDKDVEEVREFLKKANAYIPCSTKKDIQYLLTKLDSFMDEKEIDPWKDEMFVGIASKYSITKENLHDQHICR